MNNNYSTPRQQQNGCDIEAYKPIINEPTRYQQLLNYFQVGDSCCLIFVFFSLGLVLGLVVLILFISYWLRNTLNS